MIDDLCNFMKEKFNLYHSESTNQLQLVTVARECHKKKEFGNKVLPHFENP